MIIGMVRATAGFECLYDEGEPRGLEREISKLLQDGEWRTADEIRKHLGVRKDTVTAALKADQQLFRSEPGDRHGRSPNARLWQLADETGPAAVVELFTQRTREEQT